ncbi:AraC family transcriptional regulator [Bacillus nakamurai]|uniref:AraC family transcriptional regulator n=1 Tax=Bacillus nakamurai TaxID=1793963 RepID=UPI00268BD773|nr:AraC family transcriptional regulator [Bacillus nakamurai]
MPESSYRYSWEKYSDKLETIKKLHFDDLKTVGEISKELDIPDWTILDLLKANKVDKLPYPELSKRRRARDFDLLYDLHFNKKMSLKEIGRKYGYSPPYIRQVFKDQGIQHLAFKNQNK